MCKVTMPISPGSLFSAEARCLATIMVGDTFAFLLKFATECRNSSAPATHVHVVNNVDVRHAHVSFC